jgi:hypothetical protein
MDGKAVDVLAQTLSFKASRDPDWQATIEGTFLCPGCQSLHNFTEVFSAIPANFSASGREYACGLYVRVLMPWEEGK